jgi:uncharacterized membrane protein
MRLGLDTPLWLLALLPVAFLVLRELGLLRRARSAAPAGPARRRQAVVATWVRTAALALLVLALAGPTAGAAAGAVDVVFLVDGSDSVAAQGRAAALDWVDAALAAKPASDRAALAVAGRTPQLEHGLREDPPGTAPAVVVDSSATDLGAAVRLGQGMLGSERRRRAILLSDGRETTGDLTRAAEVLAADGIALDVVPLTSGAPADLLVEEVQAPNRVREGEEYTVTGVLRNTGAAPAAATVVFSADGTELERRDVTAAPGRSEVTVVRTATTTGVVRYEVRLLSAASTVAENDVARSAVQVAGPASVLVLEGTAGLGADLEAALASSGLPVTRAAVDALSLPPLDALLAYDSVVLVDVPAGALGARGMATLDAFVRDAGRGLVAVAGESSFGLGGYEGTPLEDLLPVFATITDPKRRPDVAQALVVDTSGSMAACHCADEGAFGGAPVEGGPVKTDIAKEAVRRAVDALESQDTLGVLAFNDRNDWVVPLQQLPGNDVVDAGLARIHPDGGTSIAPAVRRAIEGLRDVDARLRHIVLFTDGFESAERSLVTVAEEAAEAGVTLSVVATGEGDMRVLEDMAEAGGGRFYPGRDLDSIPDIIALEVSFAARPIVNEGRFTPILAALGPATEGLDATPPLLGYVATSPKPTARTQLRIGEDRDPLLATWQAGLGTTTAWTSDATARWSAAWVTWDRFAGFWSAVVRETLPSREDPQFALGAVAGAEGVRVTMEVAEGVGDDVRAVAVVTDPEGERVEVELDRTSLTTFSGVAPSRGEGVYAVTGRLQRGEEDLYVDAVAAVASYSQEYVAGEADPELLARVAALTGGRVDPDPSTAFAATGLAPGTATRQLWPWLAALALLLAVADVAVRRLRLERADLGRALAVVRRARLAGVGHGAPVTAERSAAAEGLLAARDRARARERGAAPMTGPAHGTVPPPPDPGTVPPTGRDPGTVPPPPPAGSVRPPPGTP